jgi:hypothetical protein
MNKEIMLPIEGTDIKTLIPLIGTDIPVWFKPFYNFEDGYLKGTIEGINLLDKSVYIVCEGNYWGRWQDVNFYFVSGPNKGKVHTIGVKIIE